MHSIYCFLIRVPHSKGNTVKDIHNYAQYKFESDYVTDWTDDNNWYDILGSVNSDGEVFDTGDGRFTDLIKRFKKMGKDSRWEKSIEYSLDLVRGHISFYNHGSFFIPDNSTKEDLIKDLAKIVGERILPPMLHKADEVLVSKSASTEDKFSASSLIDWHTEKMKSMKVCLESCQKGAFSRKMQMPYDYSCFDLRTSTKQIGNARDVVLFVDMHT
jgi:hypothetical protein